MGAAGEGPGSSENCGAWPGGLHPEPQQEGHRAAAAAAAQQVQDLHVPWHEAERGLPPGNQLHLRSLTGRAWKVSICLNTTHISVFITICEIKKKKETDLCLCYYFPLNLLVLLKESPDPVLICFIKWITYESLTPINESQMIYSLKEVISSSFSWRN